MRQPNIDHMMNMTKEFLSGEIDDIDYTLNLPYEIEKRYKKMLREDDDFKKLIRKQYNYIKKIAKEGFY